MCTIWNTHYSNHLEKYLKTYQNTSKIYEFQAFSCLSKGLTVPWVIYNAIFCLPSKLPIPPSHTLGLRFPPYKSGFPLHVSTYGINNSPNVGFFVLMQNFWSAHCSNHLRKKIQKITMYSIFSPFQEPRSVISGPKKGVPTMIVPIWPPNSPLS